MAKNAIIVKGLYKEFRLPHEKKSSLKGMFVSVFKGRQTFERQRVLSDVSFEIKEGEFFGIVGRNGSGKSTLLKLLAGIYTPDKGTIEIQGRVTPFIELGVGFNHELSGRENVYMNGALLGVSRKEMGSMYGSIVEFAELEKFMDQKLKNYSSGMQVRLAFSIAIHAKSEVLIMDEVLAVGDGAFQKKCLDVFRELKKQGTTIILVTHDMSNVEKFCDRVLVLDRGGTLKLTTPQKAVGIYSRLNINEQKTAEETDDSNETRWGTGGIAIKSISFIGKNDKESKVFKVGERFRLEIKIERQPDYKNTPIVCGLAFYNQDGANIAGPNTSRTTISPKTNKLSYTIDELPLVAGEYQLTVALFDESSTTPFDMRDREFSFSIVSDYTVHGLVELKGSWKSTD